MLSLLSVLSVMLAVVSCRSTDSVFLIAVPDGEIEISFLDSDMVRVAKYPGEERPWKFSPSVTMEPQNVKVRMETSGGKTVLSSPSVTVTYDPVQDFLTFSDKEGRVLLREKPHSFSASSVDSPGESSRKISQTFILEDGEAVYGLGQHQQGGLNQRGREVRLLQENMEIAMPVVHSIKGYALLWDNASPTFFRDGDYGMEFSSEDGDFCDYYFIYGGNPDAVVAALRRLTGQTPMPPLWSFGFFQSKERYATQDELTGVVRKYRELGVPLDCIVQDWRYWGDDHHYWNAVDFLSPGFPDPEGMMDEIHGMNARTIISVWPSFGPDTEIFGELDRKGLLMPHETFPQNYGVRNYDPWNPEARDIYWKYIKRNLYDAGLDGWWLDATEPEHNPVKPEDYDFQTGCGTFRSVRNSFPIMSVKGVYEGQRKATEDRRVLILTRSAYPGQQRYGTHVWSGDIHASWDVLHAQIPAALNFSLCGMPYWNSDIGGFWTWQNYPDGVEDPGYRKLYLRWMQFAVFTGMMRSHGSNTPREIFRFGERGDREFDIYEKFITLRYRLLPYIYGTAWQVTSQGGSLMRPLMMDWPHDGKVLDIDDEYMFGKSFLVAPIVTGKDSREIYLPEGLWIDFWSGETFEGGRSIFRDTPLEEVPLYVRAGSVLPVGPSVQYACEKDWNDLCVRIYPGADGEFVLYEDAGDGYGYEHGEYSTVRMTWDDASGVLTLHPRKGSWPGMKKERTIRAVLAGTAAGCGLDNEICDVKTVYTGKKTSINLK